MKAEKKKCIIFGASKGGGYACDVLSRDYEVIGFSDNNKGKWGTSFYGKKIFPTLSLTEFKDCEIVIASVYYKAIHQQLLEMGLTRISVFYRIGHADSKKQMEYELYRIPEERAFASCEKNEALWKEMESDFSLNFANNVKHYARQELRATGRKNVLFCAYIFPPLGGSGVQRSLKFVKYLRNFGYEPIVLTVGKNDKRVLSDKSLLEELPKDLTVIRVDQDVFLPELLSKEKQLEIFNLYGGVVQSPEWMDECMAMWEKHDTRLIPDGQMIWVNECLRNIEGLLDLTKIDIVYTTGDPFSTFMLGYYLKGKYGMKWVMDYRDPWMSNQFYLDYYYTDRKYARALQEELERRLVLQADAIVSVAKAMSDEFNQKYGIPENKLFEITNGYDEEDFREISFPKSRNEKWTICYSGTVHGNRNVVVVLEAVNELIQNGEIQKEEIQWIFNGLLNDGWREKIQTADRYGIVVFNGYLDHLKSLELSVQSNLLVLCGESGSGTNIVYTGKVFEYLRTKVPVLSLSAKGGVLDHILDETKAGRNFDYADREGISRFVLEQYHLWKNNKLSVMPADETAIQQYSRENICRKLAGIFADALKRYGKRGAQSEK